MCVRTNLRSESFLVFQISAENFGKVQSAEIGLAPLVMLIGKNNTGKSYIATLLWAASNLQTLLLTDEAKRTRPEWFKKYTKTKISAKPSQISVDIAMMAEVVEHVNNLLSSEGASFFNGVFAFDGFERSRVTIKSADSVPIELSCAVTTEDLGTDRSRATINTAISYGEKSLIRQRSPAITRVSDGWANRMYTDVVGLALFGKTWLSLRNPLYIPAARTGLMLALRSLVTQSFEADEEVPTQILPKPLASFLQRMTYPFTRGQNKELLDWFTKDVTDGALEWANERDFPDFSYRPANTGLSLPLHAASSMITELAPFLVALSDTRFLRYVIFEEPEAHLHLAAQRHMARAIARLVSAGVNVVLTSHSDTFVQQINNLMTLHGHSRQADLMEKFGYEADDLIDPAKVRAYEFNESEGGTIVSELANTASGFIVQSLNDTLLSLAEETMLLQEDVDD